MSEAADQSIAVTVPAETMDAYQWAYSRYPLADVLAAFVQDLIAARILERTRANKAQDWFQHYMQDQREATV